MKKVLVDIPDCNEGDLLAEDVISRFGTTVVTENTTINNYIKDKLLELGIRQVKVYVTGGRDAYENEAARYQAFKDNYKSAVMDVKSVLQQLACGKRPDIELIGKISDSLYRELDENSYIVKFLSEMRDADEYTYTHSVNVAFYSMLIAKWMKLPQEDIRNIVQAGLIHDIGKTKVPQEILNKRGNLTPQEFEEIKKHTVYGYKLIENANEISENTKFTVLMHHEREDRSGYPLGISKNSVNQYSKIVAVADVFDAMTSDRIYKKRATPFEAFEMFQVTGLVSFDVKALHAFLSNIYPYYIGINVMLSSGEAGEVVYIPPTDISRPVVKAGGKYIDLVRESSISIISLF